jgi:hypothetical protein
MSHDHFSKPTGRLGMRGSRLNLSLKKLHSTTQKKLASLAFAATQLDVEEVGHRNKFTITSRTAAGFRQALHFMDF